MAQLPHDKVPKVDSPGERHRNKQLMMQLPKQDLSLAYCHNLESQSEKKAFQDFINCRNETALDIATVQQSNPKATVRRWGVSEGNVLVNISCTSEALMNNWNIWDRLRSWTVGESQQQPAVMQYCCQPVLLGDFRPAKLSCFNPTSLPSQLHNDSSDFRPTVDRLNCCC